MEEVGEEEVEEEEEEEALAHGGGGDRANSVQSQAYDRIIQVGNQRKQKLSLHNSYYTLSKAKQTDYSVWQPWRTSCHLKPE